MRKKDFREGVKREGLPINAYQADWLFEKIDIKKDQHLDLEEWLMFLKEDKTLERLREVIAKNHLTVDDLLFRLQKKLYLDGGPFMSLDEVKLNLSKIDSTLTFNQAKNIFE